MSGRFFFVIVILVGAVLSCARLTTQPATGTEVSGSTPTEPLPTPENPSPGATGIGDSYFPDLGNGGYEVQHYHIDIDVDMDLNEIVGTTTIIAVALQDLSSFNLEFLGLQIDGLSVNGEAADYERDAIELRIFAPSPFTQGQEFTAVIEYHGTPGENIDTSSLPEYSIGWGWYGDGVYVAAEPAGNSSWYPVNEHPLDKATYSFSITVEDPYIVAANGLLRETTSEGGRTTYDWSSEFPMASYLVTIAIGEFDIETQEGPNGLPIRNYFGADVRETVRDDFAGTPEMIQVFSELFGPYPFEAYGVVVHDLDLGFALETQTLAVFGRSFTNEEVVSHELSHMWFGDSVGLESWQDIWLNEGFATYSSALWTEHAHGQAQMEAELRNMYASMAPGETVYELSKFALVSGLRELMPAGETYTREQVETAVTILMTDTVPDDDLNAALTGVSETLSTNEVIELIDSFEFPFMQLPSSRLSAFFAESGLNLLSLEFQASLPPPGDPGPNALFSSSVYQRGTLTLHALRMKVGDEDFFEILQTYYAAFAHSNADTQDFIAVAEEVSGQDLGDFFDAWLYQDEIPDIPEMGLFRTDFLP
ncbi:MAG: M1 family metallopeptidase [Anaerolineales bacterium]